MSSKKYLQWIEEGYSLASNNGIKSLNIELTARRLNKNKSSFYHYFGDIEVFLEELLKLHINKVEQLAKLAKNCKSVNPELLNLFIEYKDDLFFHKQLRINRDEPEFKRCFEEAFKKVDNAIIDQWSDFLGLQDQPLFAQAFLYLIADNFLLQITPQTFNYEWLNKYLKGISTLLIQMNTKS